MRKKQVALLNNKNRCLLIILFFTLQLILITSGFINHTYFFRWAPFQTITRFKVINENGKELNPKDLHQIHGMRKFHYDKATNHFVEFNSVENITASLHRSSSFRNRSFELHIYNDENQLIKVIKLL